MNNIYLYVWNEEVSTVCNNKQNIKENDDRVIIGLSNNNPESRNFQNPNKTESNRNKNNHHDGKSGSNKAHDIQILIVNYSDLLIGLIAASCLQSFGQNIHIVSTDGNQLQTPKQKQPEYQALNILGELKLALPIVKEKTLESFLRERQDYTLILSFQQHPVRNSTHLFSGLHYNFNSTNWIPSEMLKKIKLVNNKFFLNLEDIQLSDATKISKEIHKSMFDFYLKEICGKEMLGADSCGVSCDL